MIRALDIFFYVLEILIFVRIVFSWVPGMGYRSAIGQLIYNLTEPILGPCRRMLDKSPLGGGMMLDFSPIIALIIMALVSRLLVSLVNIL
ncbi:YggT family protein [Anaerotignum lactatifermentans]|uniref:YggT family protein n=1 Tax=Anaerotignum lactatifermentans TaxID=160404 RepID=UPI001FAF6F24|nr:YggT family protein [Anaerotignum lactatifermentans]